MVRGGERISISLRGRSYSAGLQSCTRYGPNLDSAENVHITFVL